jgi:hypothetical protein
VTHQLTREELAHGRALLKAAFDGPWRYTQFEIECGPCNGGDSESCSNPECTGAGGGPPATFVEAPKAYPASDKRPQIVATIEVPGISDLAQQNGEAICWLRNNAEALIAGREQLDLFEQALRWLSTSLGHMTYTMGLTDDGGHGWVLRTISYAKSLGWTGGRDA